MENSVDYVAVHSNYPDREFGTKSNPIIQILCKTNRSLFILCVL